jgi:hypothetical protein
MKSFLKRLAARGELGRVGGRCSFRDLGMGETAALSVSKGMRRGQVFPVNKPLKKQVREPWNERKGFMVLAQFNCECFAELKR